MLWFDISLKKANDWLAFFVMLAVCVPKLRSSEVVTSRFLAANTLSSSTLCRKHLWGMGVLSLVKCKT